MLKIFSYLKTFDILLYVKYCTTFTSTNEEIAKRNLFVLYHGYGMCILFDQYNIADVTYTEKGKIQWLVHLCVICTIMKSFWIEKKVVPHICKNERISNFILWKSKVKMINQSTIESTSIKINCQIRKPKSNHA